MSKDKYTRQNVKSDIMEKVLIRVDYEGVSDIAQLIIKLKPKWLDSFKSYQKVTNNNYNINVTDLALEKRTISIPDPERQVIHRFSGCKLGNPNTYMDISERFAYIDISAGANYIGTQCFTEIMAKYIHELLKTDPFIRLTRVAIRKIDRVIVNHQTNTDDIIEQPISQVYVTQNRVPLKKHYSDIMMLTDVDSIVNIERDLSLIKDRNDIIVKQIILDMDIYKQGEKQIGISRETSMDSIKNVLESKLNDPLFGLYIESFKESYIDANFYKP